MADLRWLPGDLAVELFFVISGFYMQLVLSTKYTEQRLGKFWIPQFYKARYFRLLPTYLLGSAIVVVTASLRPASAPISIWRYLWQLPNTAGNLLFKIFLCFTNTTMIFQDATMFFAVHHRLIAWSANFWKSDMPLWQGLTIPQAWSLGTELNFYLIAPYLLTLRSSWLWIASICGLTVKILVIKGFNLGDPWGYRFFPFELGYFILGALAFRYRHALENLAPPRIARYCVYPLVIAFAAVRVPLHLSTLAYPTGLALLLPFLFRMTSASRTDRWIGELSLSIFFITFVWRSPLTSRPAGCTRPQTQWRGSDFR